jgi:hypothetical protein
MGKYTGKTIAFSHKGGFWKTRYSYTPTCYAAIDNVMITNNTGVNYNNELFWEHEVNPTHNEFYGEAFSSSLTIVSNQDPRAVKIFKALSLESNSDAWVGQASTHVHQLPDGANELQLGNLQAFITKEGNQYSELPRSITNSSSHIEYVCSLEDITDNGSEVYALSGVSGWDVSVLTTPNVAILGGSGSTALFIDSTNTAYYLTLFGEAWFLTPFTADSPVSGAAYIYNYNSDDTITFAIGGDIITIGLGGLVSAFGSIGSWGNGIQLFSASDPAINGDPMRGQYLRLDLVNNSTTPVETYAINVDFENTKLDHSKGVTKKASPTKK